MDDNRSLKRQEGKEKVDFAINSERGDGRGRREEGRNEAKGETEESDCRDNGFSLPLFPVIYPLLLCDYRIFSSPRPLFFCFVTALRRQLSYDYISLSLHHERG